VKVEAIRAFTDRPWDELAALKRRHAAERYAREGHHASLRIARGLYARFRSLAIEGSVEGYEERRQRDLEHHVELKRLLDRARGALA